MSSHPEEEISPEDIIASLLSLNFLAVLVFVFFYTISIFLTHMQFFLTLCQKFGVEKSSLYAVFSVFIGAFFSLYFKNSYSLKKKKVIPFEYIKNMAPMLIVFGGSPVLFYAPLVLFWSYV